MKLNVNGADVDVDDRFAAAPLLWVLRDVLGLHGTKYGCGIGYCAPQVEAVLPFEQVREALERVAGRHTRGKIVLQIGS